MKTLYLAWRNPHDRSWYPIGRLRRDGEEYVFQYTQGVLRARAEAGFQPLAAFPDVGAEYRSTALFSLFTNRLLPRSRPEYGQFIEWLHVPESDAEPFLILARSGGRRTTDTLEVFAAPEPDASGGARLYFFIHGARHFPEGSAGRGERLTPGEPLMLMHDLQNPHDPNALALRTAERAPRDLHLLGFCPRYLSEELLPLLREDPQQFRVEVVRVNPPPAPSQMRVLCSLRMPNSAASKLFQAAAYQSLAAAEPEWQKVG